jgi:hypothetical protein
VNVGPRAGVSSRAAVFAATIVIVVALIGYALAQPGLNPPATTTSTSSSSSTTSSTVSTAESNSTLLPPPNEPQFAPLVDVPLLHEVCDNGSSPVGGYTGCYSASTSTLGLPQTFNMSTPVIAPIGGVQHIFGAQLSQNETGYLQFSYGNAAGLKFIAYYDSSPGSGTNETLSEHLASDPLTVLLKESFPITYFSGQIDAQQPGLYIFVVSSGADIPTYSTTFFLRDTALYGNEITIDIGGRTDINANGSISSVSGGLEEWTVNVYSSTTTSVNMSATVLPLNVWVKFVPSFLPDVGPNGAKTTLLIAGAISPFGGNELNMSVFMDAVGSNGSQGETILPVEPHEPVQVLNSPSTIKSFPETNGANELLFEGQRSVVLDGLVYDPSAASAPGSLSIGLTVSGIQLQNGTRESVPSWLTISQPELSFQLFPDEPYYYEFNMTMSVTAPWGQFSLILAETINGQSFTGLFSIFVEPPTQA